jgi:hypothetical protein
MRKVHVRYALAAMGNYVTVRQVNNPKMGAKVFEIDGADVVKDIVV